MTDWPQPDDKRPPMQAGDLFALLVLLGISGFVAYELLRSLLVIWRWLLP